MGLEIGPAHNFAELVSPKRKLSRRRDLGILLAQTSRPCVARICRYRLRFLAILYTFFIFAQLRITKFFERFDRHIHLAAHLKHTWSLLATFHRKFFRNNTDGAHICRDVFANFSVATRGRLNKFTIFVANAQCQAVNF